MWEIVFNLPACKYLPWLIAVVRFWYILYQSQCKLGSSVVSSPKYVSRVGGLPSKNSEVMLPCYSITQWDRKNVDLSNTAEEKLQIFFKVIELKRIDNFSEQPFNRTFNSTQSRIVLLHLWYQYIISKESFYLQSKGIRRVTWTQTGWPAGL